MWAGCSSIIIGLQAAGGRGNVWVGRRDPSTRSEGRLVLGCCDNQAAITPVDRGVIGAQWETVRLVRSGGRTTPGEGCEGGQRERARVQRKPIVTYSHGKGQRILDRPSENVADNAAQGGCPGSSPFIAESGQQPQPGRSHASRRLPLQLAILTTQHTPQHNGTAFTVLNIFIAPPKIG